MKGADRVQKPDSLVGPQRGCLGGSHDRHSVLGEFAGAADHRDQVAFLDVGIERGAGKHLPGLG